jgi:hypothetical protein
MIHLVLVTVGLVGLSPQEPSATSASDLKTYEAVRPKAGRDPAAHVKLALWCEAHGLDAERVRHLARAVVIDPKQVTARGLLGLIDIGGRWLSPDQVGDRRKSDPVLMKKLEEYHARRAAIEGSVKQSKRGGAETRKTSGAHEKLGAWCDEQGLKDEALAHFTMAVQLDPYNDSAWKRLGYLKRRGRWMGREQIAAEEREADAQRTADKYWEPLLRKWQGWLGEKARRAEAQELLAKVAEPAAVHAITKVFSSGPADQQFIAVSMLERIDGALASKELARLAVFNDSESVRRAAMAALKGHVLRDYVGELIEMVQSPIAYKVKPPQESGSTGTLSIDTPRFRLVRTYDVPPAFNLAGTFRGYVGYDDNGMPIVAPGIELDRMKREAPQLQAARIMRLEAATQEMLRTAAMVAQQQLVDDVNAIESFNSECSLVNQRIMPVLQSAAGSPVEKGGKDALNVWWYDQLGYQYEPPPQVTLAQNVAPEYAAPHIYTCFAAGTLVHTPEGRRPIEQMHAGDLVLSQDVTTGALTYQPVLVVHHNKPSKTLRIKMTNDETVVSSVYHRFWRSGLGWALARELNPGETLRVLGGQVKVASIEPGDVVPVFNLDVARKRSFFVGQSGMLVHDNTLPEARLTPFDAPPTLKPAAKD